MTRVADRERVIVLRWLTRHNAELLGPTLDHAYAIDESPCFDEVLMAIDEAERQVWGDCDPATDPPE